MNRLRGPKIGIQFPRGNKLGARLRIPNVDQRSTPSSRATSPKHGYNSSQAARALLDVLREPASIISAGNEAVEVADRRLIRDVRLEFVPSRARTAIYVDVLRPHKGQLANLELKDSNAPVRRLSHDQHRTISQSLVRARWLELAATIMGESGPIEVTTEQWARLVEVLRVLSGVPAANAGQAAKLLAEVWCLKSSDRGTPNSSVVSLYERFEPRLSSFPDELMASERVQRQLLLLYKLALLLAERYLEVVEIGPTRSEESVWITYRHQQRMSERGGNEGGSRSTGEDKHPRGLSSRIRAYLGAAPQTVRVHVPLAIKCAHYRFDLEAPSNYFFWWGGLLSDILPEGQYPSDRDALLVRNESTKWASGLGHGQRLMVFVGSTSDALSRPYVGAELMERPGRSTLGALILSSIAFVLGLGVATIGYLDDAVAGAAALVVSVFGLVSASAEALVPERSFPGSPLLSRLSGISTAMICGILSLWMLSRAAPSSLSAEMWKGASEVWDGWVSWGAPVLLGLLFTQTCMLLGRAWSIGDHYRFAMRGYGNRNYL